MVLQIDDLSKIRNKKHNKNHEIYKEILENICNKIHMKNRLGHVNMTYVLSPIMPGKPLVNIEHAMMYIIRKLKAGKFKVTVMNNILFIDWS